MPYPNEYIEFLHAFNDGDYYTCHDLLEEIWLTDRHHLFIKGLLQLSVALYHNSYGNDKGTQLMLEAAHQYLKPYAPVYWGLDINEILAYIDMCLNVLAVSTKEKEIQLPAIKLKIIS